MSAKAIFGTVIATILLGLYVYLAVVALGVLGCGSASGCQWVFTEEMGSALSLLAGLIAAPILAELAVTKPGEVPYQRGLGPDPTQGVKTLLKVLVIAYFVIWIAIGLLALLAGWRHPTEVEAFTSLGKTWLGLAVAAGYAYFGVTPAKT
jgi:hypothetical protein